MFYLAFFLLKLLAYFLSFIPRRLFLLLGKGLGRILLAQDFRKEIAISNIHRAFPDWSEEKRAQLLENQFQQLGILFLEFLRSFFRFDRFFHRFVDVEGEEHLQAALEKGKGVFVMTAHLGNWEVLALSAPKYFGVPATMVTKELKPEWFHRAVEVTRGLAGVKMACEPRTMSTIMRALNKKEIVGFVMDQYAGAPVGARVPFFGVPVGSHNALAVLALRTGAPVVPALAIRKPNGRFSVRFEPPIPLAQDSDSDQAVIKNTANYVSHTEKWVREFPEQWMWIHRRWKGDLSPLPSGVVGEMLK